MSTSSSVFLVLLSVMLFHSAAATPTEIEVGSVPFHSDIFPVITVGIKQADGTYQLRDRNFEEEYIPGVVAGEMLPRWDVEALKAQAVAARAWAHVNRNKHSSEGFDVCSIPHELGQHCQAYRPDLRTEGFDNAARQTTGRGVKYSGIILETTFFSHAESPAHYTKNSESKWKYYHAHLRRTVTPEDDQTGDGGHAVGMSQYGAQELATSKRLGYEDILKYYYGPVPAYVKRVKVTQNSQIKYDAHWRDNENYPDPARTLYIQANFPLRMDSEVVIEIHFSERVLTGSGAKEIRVEIEGEEAIYISGSLREANRPPEKLSKKLSAVQLGRVGAGIHTLRINARHEFAQDWQLDADPRTFAYQSHNVGKLANYERGTDQNHEIQISSGEGVSVSIDDYSANPQQVVVGADTTLRLGLTNTSNTRWTFGAAATLRKPDGANVDLPVQPVTLDPNEQGSAQWTYTIDMEGEWDLVFGVWEESVSPANSLGHTGWLTGYISATSAPQHTYTLSQGLDLISFPFAPIPPRFSDLFSELGSDLFPYVFFLNNSGGIDYRRSTRI